MIAGMTYYQIFWYFLFYSFGGWVVEVMYHAVACGKVINRGFLNGPLCPVYGFGMLVVLAGENLAGSVGIISISAAEPDLKSLVILFLGSMVFATLVELIAGWLLDINFHMRWWDYTGKPFNFRGYICLQFSIIWGLSITGVILLIHPVVEKSQSLGIPERIGWPLLAGMYAVAFADFCVTVAAVRGLNRRLEELNRLQKNMRVISDGLSRTIGESTIRTAQFVGEGQVQAALARAELRDRMEEYRGDQMLKIAAGKRRARRIREELSRKPALLMERLPENPMQAGKDILQGKTVQAGRDILQGKTVQAGKDILQRSGARARAELLHRKEALEKRKSQLLAELSTAKMFSPGRILKKVPDLRHSRYGDLLEELKQRMSTDTRKR